MPWGLIAMRAIPLLLGCLLSLGAIANATAAGTTAAASMGKATSYNCTSHSADASPSHDSTATSGDAFNIPHSSNGSTGSSSRTHPSASPTNTDDTPVHMGGGDATNGNASHSSGLSWQSLLPGSIQ
jgi:hypothetical protein